jgi:hypothetical protein
MHTLWRVLMVGLGASGACIGVASAQENEDRPPPVTSVPGQVVVCPPDVKGPPPTVGGPSAPNLSDRLSDSKGVICPPLVDPGAEVPPPAGGTLKIIPPPGSPGGDPTVQPK